MPIMRIILCLAIILESCQRPNRDSPAPIGNSQAPVAIDEQIKSLLPISKVYNYQPNSSLDLNNSDVETLAIGGSVIAALVAVVGAGAFIGIRGKAKMHENSDPNINFIKDKTTQPIRIDPSTAGTLNKPTQRLIRFEVPKKDAGVSVRPETIEVEEPHVSVVRSPSELVDMIAQDPSQKAIVRTDAHTHIEHDFLRVEPIPSRDPNINLNLVSFAPPKDLKITSINEQIGEGAQGTVFNVKINGLKGDYVAKRFNGSGDLEIKANEMLTGHPGVTRYLGKSTLDGQVFAIFEKMDGDVAKSLESATFAFEPKMVDDLLDGLQYIYSKNIEYIDIKPQNMLYKKNASGSLSVKFADINPGAGTRQYYEILPKELSKEQESLSALGLSLLEMRSNQTAARIMNDPELLFAEMQSCKGCMSLKEQDVKPSPDLIFRKLETWIAIRKRLNDEEWNMKGESLDRDKLTNDLQKLDPNNHFINTEEWEPGKIQWVSGWHGKTDRKGIEDSISNHFKEDLDVRVTAFQVLLNKAKIRNDSYDQLIENMIYARYKTTSEAIADLAARKFSQNPK